MTKHSYDPGMALTSTPWANERQMSTPLGRYSPVLGLNLVCIYLSQGLVTCML